MDFFDRQDHARRHTTQLVVLFILAVIAIVLSVNLVAAIGLGLFADYRQAHVVALNPPMQNGFAVTPGWPSAPQGSPPQTPLELLRTHARLFGLITLGTLAVILGGTLYRISSLAGGGQVVALSLGGRQVNAHTADPNERKLLNVVEEMAIASGVPVPPVFILDREAGINAFAAGHSQSDAVIAVTRGGMVLLSRDELQGVIGHEFSHILHGDSRLNLRLMGTIFGISAIGLVGYGILRLGFDAGLLSDSEDDRGAGMAIMVASVVIGALLIVVGYTGVFFGNLIKAAISRQREFLADASSVQFTRNPGGLSGALQKIGGLGRHGLIVHPQAHEASHFFFAQSFDSPLNALFATHPPLQERIHRIDPQFDGSFPTVQPVAPMTAGAAAAAATRGTGLGALAGLGMIGAMAAGSTGATPAAGSAPAKSAPSAGGATAVEAIGQPSPAQIDYARHMIAQIPEAVRQESATPYGARSVVLALLLDRADQVRQRQVQTIADLPLRQLTLQMRGALADLPTAARLMVLDLALPALRQMSFNQFAEFHRQIESLIAADDRLDLFEWMLQQVLTRHLGPAFGRLTTKPVQYYSLKPVASACASLLATLAYAGQKDDADAHKAFQEGWAVLGLPQLPMPEAAACSLKSLQTSLDALAAVSPREKRTLLSAGLACIASNKAVNDREAELFRAVADVLGIPVPPILPGQPIG